MSTPDVDRSRPLNSHEYQHGSVIYWMSRDLRAQDNHALLYAQEFAIEHKQPLKVVFGMMAAYKEYTWRQYDFMLRGLQETEVELRRHNIPLELVWGIPADTLPEYVTKHQIGIVFTDFSPLHDGRKWRDSLAKELQVPLIEVDAHNVVPCWLVSDKQEYAARTIRPKLMKLLPLYRAELGTLVKHPFGELDVAPIDWAAQIERVTVDRSVPPVKWLGAGPRAAREVLELFIKNKLPGYAAGRNKPEANVVSNLSPYIHFGQISAQRIGIEVCRTKLPPEMNEAFLEELFVRRELADNFCYYNPNYDKFEGFPNWAQKSLNAHRNDKREYIYTLEDFEHAATHSNLWNAAQKELVTMGKMHGYLRMYWAKKILEWSASPEEALEITNHLNNKYELDGNDPNGYVGAAWSIGGVHDRPWFERPIFGYIRYMSDSGMERKFAVDKYISHFGHINE